MKEQEYIFIRNKIDAEYEKKLTALNLIHEMCKDCPEVVPVRKLPWRSTEKIVHEAVDVQDDKEFTSQDLYIHIIDLHPDLLHCLHRTSISSVLRRFVKKGNLIRVKVGGGTRPSTYKKVKD